MQVSKGQAVLIFILFFPVFIFCGCGVKKLERKEYLAWVKESSSLNQKKQIGDMIFEIQYNTPDYILLKESRGNKIDQQEFLKKKKELEGMQYFDLKIYSSKGKDIVEEISGDKEEYFKKINYLTFNFQKDIKLKENDQEYECVVFHLEKMYDLSNAKLFQLGFDSGVRKKENIQDINLEIDARELGVGLINFKIKAKDLQEIPELETL